MPSAVIRGGRVELPLARVVTVDRMCVSPDECAKLPILPGRVLMLFASAGLDRLSTQPPNRRREAFDGTFDHVLGREAAQTEPKSSQ